VPDRSTSWPRRFLGRLCWWELIPEAVLLAGLTWFLVDETDAATSAFASTRAIVLMLTVALGWVLLRVVLAFALRWPALRLVLFGAAAVVVLAVVVLPAYDDTTVVEAFPNGPSRATSTTSAGAVEPSPSSPPSTAAPDPVVLASGALEGIDHRASGTVRIYRRADGSHVVGLEEIDVQPGPDYDVYVVPGPDREDHDDGTRLDDLRGNQGTQFYDVGGEADLEDGDWTVLIWCQTFAVPVAHATPV
jgi:hypothetical protein